MLTSIVILFAIRLKTIIRQLHFFVVSDEVLSSYSEVT